MTPTLELRFIEPAGALYLQERDLRYELLRAPLGRPRGSEAFPFERGSLHLVALRDATVVGCVLFHPDGSGGGRLYQMAVHSALQGEGVGRRLVHHLEAHLRREGFETVELHARAHVAGFYEGLGYAVVGEPYDEVGIPHVNMSRPL